MQASSDKNRLQQFTTLALAVSKRVLPNHGSKFAPKTYTQPQLLACLLLKEYLRLDYRTTQEMLELNAPQAASADNGINDGLVFGFRVDDVEAASAAVEAAGCELLGEITRVEEVAYAYRRFRGPDGRVYSLN